MDERLIAMVATKDAARLTPKTLRDALTPLLRGDEGEPHIVQAKGEKSSLVVTLAGVTVALLSFPFPIPPETLGSALGNEVVWRAAADAFQEAGAHVLLAVITPENDPARSVAHAQVLTLATAAVIRAAAATGVFWSAADSVVEPARFAEEAAAMPGSAFPPSAWFSFRFFPGPNGVDDPALVCQSTGLSAFLGREVECGPYRIEAGELADKVLLFARYMASAGPVFGDGHTFSFGDSDSTDAILRFDWSRLGGVERPVFRIELAAQEAPAR